LPLARVGIGFDIGFGSLFGAPLNLLRPLFGRIELRVAEQANGMPRCDRAELVDSD
jgi:hypothetical protein